SYVSKQALAKKAVRGVVAEIDLPDGATLTQGKAREVLDQLEGRNETASSATPWSISPSTADRVKVEWVVHAPQGGDVTLTARHDRAGKVQATITLDD
ncbi:MAG: carboxypeptidase, partial [Anaerolineae bacterium]